MSVSLLLGFAMELYLKSWLIDMGHDKELKSPKIAHNLNSLLDLTYENGLHHMNDIDLVVKFLNENHSDYSNRYMKRGTYKQVPFKVIENVFAIMDVIWTARLRLPPPPRPSDGEIA